MSYPDILNFTPLLIWCLFFPLLWDLSERVNPSNDPDRAATNGAKLFILGMWFWMVVAILLSIAN